MKTLVTGGAGFLGRYIVERLIDRGDQVSIFTRGAYPEIDERDGYSLWPVLLHLLETYQHSSLAL